MRQPKEVARDLTTQRIGAYGGTFDPIHNGHIEVARAVVRNLRLDKLLIVPANRPPHKESISISEAYHRYAMSVLATLAEPGMLVSTIEIEAPDRPYTFETLDRLRDFYGPKARLLFVMGSDSFREIETWRRPDRVLSNADIVVAARPGHEVDVSALQANLKARVVDLRGQEAASSPAAQVEESAIYLTDYVRRDVSSTRIRRMVGEGLPIREYVPRPVADYIDKYELYRRDFNGSANRQEGAC